MTTTAGELRPVDIGRPIEFDYVTDDYPTVKVAGRLRAFHANGEEIAVWVVGDPHWSPFEPIPLTRGDSVTVGDHPEASRR